MKDAAHWAHVRILMCNSDLEDLIVQVQRDALAAAVEICRDVVYKHDENCGEDFNSACDRCADQIEAIMPPSAAEGGK